MELDRFRTAIFALTLVAFGAGAGAALSGVLGDKKPNPGVAAAHDMPIQGIDVSYFQGNVDWTKVEAAGIRFAYIKVTEGGDRFDPNFRDNWAGAKQAGIARGAYHMIGARADRPPPGGNEDWRVVVDLTAPLEGKNI